MLVTRSLSAQMFELSSRWGVQGQGRVRGDHSLPPDQPGVHQASGADHQVCVCQCDVLCKLHANVSEVRSAQRITTKFQTHDDSVNVNMSSYPGVSPRTLLYFLSVLMFWRRE